MIFRVALKFRGVPKVISVEHMANITFSPILTNEFSCQSLEIFLKMVVRHMYIYFAPTNRCVDEG